VVLVDLDNKRVRVRARVRVRVRLRLRLRLSPLLLLPSHLPLSLPLYLLSPIYHIFSKKQTQFRHFWIFGWMERK
jgi:hypothetical protein